MGTLANHSGKQIQQAAFRIFANIVNLKTFIFINEKVHNFSSSFYWNHIDIKAYHVICAILNRVICHYRTDSEHVHVQIIKLAT
jgi:hypothetical protein